MPKLQTDIDTAFKAPIKQALPNEIIACILDVLISDDQLRAVARLAQANCAMYDLAIPSCTTLFVSHLETGFGYFTDVHVRKLRGTRIDHSPTHVTISEPTRKDRAMKFSRKLVLDKLPTWDLARYFEFQQTIKEVGATHKCLHEDINQQECPDLYLTLSKLAPTDDEAPPLHITCHLPQAQRCTYLYQLIKLGSHDPIHSSNLITYEIFTMPISSEEWASLDIAFALRAVVHFGCTPTANPDDRARMISSQLLECFETGETDPLFNSGPIYLCDIPKLILSPAELYTAVDHNETALRKLFNGLNYLTYPEPQSEPDTIPRTKWETFTSKVKLVESGFRPSRADLVDSDGAK